MLVRFNNPYLEKLYENRPVTGKPQYAAEVIQKYKKTVLLMQLSDNIRDIRKHKGLNFEALKGKWKGYYSVRVDYHYRLILSVEEDGSIAVRQVIVIEDLTNHYQ